MSWASDRKAERIGMITVTLAASTLPAIWAGSAFIQKVLERSSTYSQTTQPTPGTTTDKLSPFTITSLNCTDFDIKGSVAYPHGGQLRAGPGPEYDPAGTIYTNTTVDIKRIIRREHAEGSRQDWVIIDPTSIPGHVSPAVSEAYIRLGILASDKDAGLYTNDDISKCEPGAEKP